MVRAEMGQDWLRQGGSLVLGTVPGEDVTRAMDSVITGVGSFRVLRHTASKTGANEPLRGLAGLLSRVHDTELGQLPQTQQALLRLAVSGVVPAEEQPDGFLGGAVLALLRALAQSRPVLLVIENSQWMDPVSTEVLQYVAARLGGLAVQVAVAVGTADDTIRDARLLCPPPLLVILR